MIILKKVNKKIELNKNMKILTPKEKEEKKEKHKLWLENNIKGIRANFSKKIIKIINFKKAELPKSNFKGSVLKVIEFIEANLQNADFKNTKLSNIDFHNANLKGVKFNKATFDKVHIDIKMYNKIKKNLTPKQRREVTTSYIKYMLKAIFK